MTRTRSLLLVLALLGVAACNDNITPSVPGGPARVGKIDTGGPMQRRGAAIVIDWRKGGVQSVTLDGDRALVFTGGQPGGKYVLSLTQDAIGSRMVTWPANVYWPGVVPGGTPPTLTT